MDKPTVKLLGTDSNVFALAGKVAQALTKAGQKDKAKEFRNNLWKAKDYDEALLLMQEYVIIE